MSETEERLRSVYRSYLADARLRKKWDPRNPGNQYIWSERLRAMDLLLAKHGRLPLGHTMILDVGCGSGRVLASLMTLGARVRNLYGVDLLPEHVLEGRSRFPRLQLQCASAERLPFRDETFDLILAFAIFGSVRKVGAAERIADEIRRVLRSDGGVLCYEARIGNPANRDTTAFGRRALTRLFPGFGCDVIRITLVPAIARRLPARAAHVYRLLALPRTTRTHYLGFLSKR